MITRAEVEAAIATIEDNGNNKASEVRTVFSKLLDYTENDPAPIPESVDFFHFSNNEKPVNTDVGRLWYSCKGIEKDRNGEPGTANFTFKLELLEANVDTFLFQIQQEFYKKLREIAPSDRPLTFTVPLFSSNLKNPIPVTLVLKLVKEDHLELSILTDAKLAGGGEIYTSIQFHSKKFFDEE